MQRDANVLFIYLFLHRQEPHHQGFPALPEHHPGGPAARRGPGTEEQLEERRGKPVGDPGAWRGNGPKRGRQRRARYVGHVGQTAGAPALEASPNEPPLPSVSS